MILLLVGVLNADNAQVVNVGRASKLMASAPYRDGFDALGLNRDNRDVDDNGITYNGASALLLFGEKSYIPSTMFSLSDIFTAYYDCRENKRNTLGALEFELHYETECIDLWNEINNRSYTLKPSTAFIVRDPVQREIFASHFRDRVVHHLIARRLTPILERVLIHDVYSSRKGKGTHYGIKRVDHFMRSCSENYSRDAYVLKLDISGFFMSIDREILWKKVETLIMKYVDSDEQEIMLYIIRSILFTDVREGVIIAGDRIDWVGLPHNKSLFYARPGCGLPIGNLTSQLFANIYMHSDDTFVKKTLNMKHYGRYVDDFILVHQDKKYLKLCIPLIRDFLREQLGLTLHPRKIYLQHISKGVLFLGTFIKPYRRYVGKRTKGNFYQLIRNINTRFSDPTLLSDLEQDHILAQMNSYLGLLSHTQSYILRSKMIQLLHSNFFLYFLAESPYMIVSIKPK